MRAFEKAPAVETRRSADAPPSRLFAIAHPLITLVDNDPAATRADPAIPLWHVADRTIDLSRRLRGLPRRDAHGLLARLLRLVVDLGQPWYLAADPSTPSTDLGGGPWTLVTPGTWRAPSPLTADDFLESGIHTVGNYILYSRAAPLPIEAWEGVELWGWRRSDAAVVRALQRLGIDAAIAVHPDASDWFLALPTLSAVQAPQN